MEKTKSNFHYSLAPYHRAVGKIWEALREKKNIDPPKIGCRIDCGINIDTDDQNNVPVVSLIEKANNGNYADASVATTNQDHYHLTIQQKSQPPRLTHYVYHTKGIFANHSKKAIST